MKSKFCFVVAFILLFAALTPLFSTQAQSAPLISPKRLAAYYFYWYRYDNLHFYDPDGSDALTDHPPDEYLASTTIDYSFFDPDWHRRELLDLMDAGVEIILPVFWGDHTNEFWSKPGLQALVQAEAQMISEGLTPPQIGMFYDTSALLVENGNIPPDLTTSEGKALFYSMIDEYFDLIPDHTRWARMDGKPIIYLYVSSYVADYDQSTFDYVDAQFAANFSGETPYIVREVSWGGVVTEGVYAWGAAVNGPNFFGDLAAIGPGYDDSAVYGRTPTYRNRECGEFYQDSWEQVIDSSAALVALETWNEFHEGTDVAASYEYGWQYIESTAQNVLAWKGTDTLARPYAFIDLGHFPYSRGIRAANAGDGTWRTTFRAGRQTAYPDHSSTPDASYHIYLNVDDAYILGQAGVATSLWVMVEYFDSGNDSWFLQYDSVGPAEIPYVFRVAGTVQLTNTSTWKRMIFYLPDAYFANRQQNGLADLRLVDAYDGVTNYFGRVWVFKTNPSALHAPDLLGLDDLLLMPGADLNILLTPSDPDGGALNLTLDRAPAFAGLHDNGNGTYTINLHPEFADLGPCNLRLRLLVTDSSTPAMLDAVTIVVRVSQDVYFLPLILR